MDREYAVFMLLYLLILTSFYALGVVTVYSAESYCQDLAESYNIAYVWDEPTCYLETETGFQSVEMLLDK